VLAAAIGFAELAKKLFANVAAVSAVLSLNQGYAKVGSGSHLIFPLTWMLLKTLERGVKSVWRPLVSAG